MQTIAIILAGGAGQRVGHHIPKQFLKIEGKTVLEYSLEKFNSSPLIDEIVIVVHPSWKEVLQAILDSVHFSKVKHLVEGGAERYHSVLAALNLHNDKDCLILIHDAARPLVSEHIIKEVVTNLSEYNAVNVAIPAQDTIIQVDCSHTFIIDIPDRNNLLQVQTPQGFRLSVLKQAYQLALRDSAFTTTDDCSVVKKYLPEEKIKIVAGDNINIKITYPEDLIMLQEFIKHSQKQ